MSPHVTFATYNCNAMLANLPIITSIPADIIAIQETRLTELQLKTVARQASDCQLHLFNGTLAAEKQYANRYAVDKKHPGVAFLVRQHLSAYEPPTPDAIAPWHSRGYLCLLSVFLRGAWVTCLNMYCPLSQDAVPLLPDIHDFCAQHAHLPVVLLGDFNANVVSGDHPKAFTAIGFRSLATEESFDFHTFKAASRSSTISTSAIDNILVSEPLAEFVSPLCAIWPRRLGHAIITTTAHIDITKVEPFEVVMPPVARQLVQDTDWRCFSSCPTVLWNHFCSCLDKAFQSQGRPRGSSPLFRKRDFFKAIKARVALSAAFCAQDYDTVASLLEAERALSLASIRTWISRMKHKDAAIWTRATARWVKRPTLALPLSIEVSQGANTYRTIGTAELQDAAFSYYKQLYNSGESYTLPDRKAICADLFPAAFQWDSFDREIQSVISAACSSRAPGLDGTYVEDYKLLPQQGRQAFSRFCYAILQTGRFPDSWLNIKVVLIPKKQGLTLKDLRPLSIAPVPYRLFGKALMRLSQHAMLNLHSHSVGGVSLEGLRRLPFFGFACLSKRFV